MGNNDFVLGSGNGDLGTLANGGSFCNNLLFYLPNVIVAVVIGWLVTFLPILATTLSTIVCGVCRGL